VRVPALRERRDDIPPLVAHFAEKYGDRFGRPISSIDRKTLDLLQAHDWPGNVRELENTIERAVILSRNGVLSVDPEMLRDPCASSASNQNETNDGSHEERTAIENALKASRGKISGSRGAAKKIGIPASTLEFRIKKLGINKFRFRHATAPSQKN
jgi:formate hydrogenlyase transcriptional activator